MLPNSERSDKHHSRPKKPLVDWALIYRRRGWSIIPTIGKKAACKWGKFQNELPTEGELRKLFSISGVDGMAVILGPVSGGLACRDFDDCKDYEKWKNEQPDLANTLPTVKTARGYHVYFRGKEGFQDFGNGEYRADCKHYVVLPPSRHPDGHRYKWVIRLSKGKLPKVDPVKAGFRNANTTNTLNTHSTEKNRRTERTQNTQSLMCSLVSLFPSIDKNEREAVVLAIAATQPQTEGQRHRMVFALCRELKAIATIAEAPAASLRCIVDQWHKQALPVIGSKPFSDTWGDFISGWERVKSPAGQGRIDEAFRRAEQAKPPRKAAKLYPDEPKVVLLAALCKELQRDAGDEDFFLGCRPAARLLDVFFPIAAKWLRLLCADGVLELREKGSQATHRASRYRYVASKRLGRGPA